MDGKQLEIRLRLQSFDKATLVKVKDRLILFACFFSLEYLSISLPKRRKKVTVLKSPHVNKKSRDQVEECVFTDLIVLKGFVTERVLNELSYMHVCGVLAKLTILSSC